MRTVFITGASSGIGRAAVKIFRSKGWSVAAAMRQPSEEKEFLTDENIFLIKCDVTNIDSITSAVNEALTKLGHIDVLINNAGVYDTKPFELVSADDFNCIIDTNIKGIIMCTQAVLPHFREKNQGTIINVSSVAGFTAFPFQTIYHASKWGVEGLSESLQYELRTFNIKVKIVEPGMVKATNLYDKLANISDESLNTYQQGFSSWYRYLKGNIPKGAVPELSAQVIYKAATDNRRKMRYQAGYDTKIIALLRILLPLSLFRFIVEKATGLR